MPADKGKKKVDLLFIGNSHTYYHDLPLLVQSLAIREGVACRVTMLAHGGWYLSQHAQEPEVRFNILHGGYDYVVLQEHAHPFGPQEGFLEAAKKLDEMIREAGSRTVLYACWARKDEPQEQGRMDEIHRRVAREIGALLAPVGERWWRGEPELYAEDGAHASLAGSKLAAGVIWETIRQDLRERERKPE